MKKGENVRLQSLEHFCEAHKDLVTIKQMRNYIYRDPDADMWVRRIGRRIFVDVDKFFEWTMRKL